MNGRIHNRGISIFVAASLVILTTSLAIAVIAQNSVHLNEVSRDVIEARLRHFSQKDSERENIVKGAFQEVGCRDANLTEQPVAHEKLPNVICVLPGSEDAEIIVGAHYDHFSEGSGVVDNWSGTALLASFYQALSAEPRKHPYVFIAFSGEEGGMHGSESYAKQLSPKQLATIRAMVNFDTLGLGPTKVWLHHSDHHLADLLYGVSKGMNLSLGVVDADEVGDEDSSSFSKRHISTLMVHSVTQESFPILHSKRDNLDAIKMADYFDTYRLLSTYLAFLDSNLN